MEFPVLKYFILLLNLVNVYCNQVSFINYCENNGTGPDAFPSSGKESSGSIVMSTSTENGTWYKANMNCTVTFFADTNYHLLLTFSNISLRNSSMDILTVYNSDKGVLSLSGQQVCTNENCGSLMIDSGEFSYLSLTFQSANATVPQNMTGFRAHYTVYDLAAKNGACKGRKQFLCDNNHCIWNELVCDGHNNCGDRSDETKCKIPIHDTIWGIVVILIAVISLIILVPLFCCIAMYGTRSIVKTVTLSTPATPLRAPLDCGETSGLLTSSEVLTNCWPGTSYERSNSLSYGTSEHEPSSSNEPKKKFRSMSEARESQVGNVL